MFQIHHLKVQKAHREGHNDEKHMTLIGAAAAMMLMASGCAKDKEPQEPVTLTYDDILPEPAQEPVIVRDEQSMVQEGRTEQAETAADAETETQTVPFADRIAEGQAIVYNIETSAYEEGAVSVEYPQLTGMVDETILLLCRLLC